jgi:hypothetical protein
MRKYLSCQLSIYCNLRNLQVDYDTTVADDTYYSTNSDCTDQVLEWWND